MDANERKAYKLYKKGGQHLVYDYVTKGLLKHDKWGYCEPCEIDSPIYDESCLVCGSIYKESAKESEVERGYDTDSTEGRGAYRDGEPAYEQTSEVV